MDRLESLSDQNYREFLGTGVRVLLLTLPGCPHCRAWTNELSEFLEFNDKWKDIRFGELDLEGNDVDDFKQNNDWLEFIEGVPFNIIYVDGQPTNSFAGSGIERLVRRLQRLLVS